MFAVLALVILLLVFFVPAAVLLGMIIIAPDWFRQNRTNVIIGFAIAELALFLAVALLLFI